MTSIWKDRVEQLSKEEGVYHKSDVIEAISPNQLTAEEEKYYEVYENNGENDESLVRLNLFDIMNAKKESYSKYLDNGEEYSDNIGYHREWMTFSFYSLRQAIKAADSSDAGWQYYYGSSAGAKEKKETSSSSANENLVNVDYSSLEGKLGWPCPGFNVVSSEFGPRWGGEMHTGMDISAPIGSTFVASANGEVINVSSNCTDNYGKEVKGKPSSSFCGGGAGNYVIIKLDDKPNWDITYMHMTSVTVQKGQKVTAGQAIGTCGTTGRSTGGHAHFRLRIGGSPVNPRPYLAQ